MMVLVQQGRFRGAPGPRIDSMNKRAGYPYSDLSRERPANSSLPSFFDFSSLSVRVFLPSLF